MRIEQGEDASTLEAKTLCSTIYLPFSFVQAERYHMVSNSSDRAFTMIAEKITLSHCGGPMQSVAGVDVSKEKRNT